MAYAYKVMMIVGSDWDGEPLYKNTRTGDQTAGEVPYDFCEHRHALIEEAQACRDFEDATPPS